MRQLALLLILANVCVYFWANYVDVPEATLTPQTPLSVPEKTPALRLAEEREAREVEAAQVTAELSCISVGPFADVAQIDSTAQRLQAAGFTSAARNENVETRVGYWVVLQGFTTSGEAEQVLKKLQAAGVSDVYLLNEESPPVVSLGLFSERERADKRSADITALGYHPVIQDRNRTVESHWLDITLQEPGQKIDPALLQPENAGIVRLETKACPVATEAVAPATP